MITPQLNLAINSLSFGNVSVGILREFFARGLTPSVHLIGGVDLSTQSNLSPEFHSWLQHCIGTAEQKASRNTPCVRLWHIQSSLQSYAKDSRLITFHEVDGLTPLETNVLKNQDKVYVTSNYTKRVFSDYGIDSTYLPLGFDSANFHKLAKSPKIKGEISFLVAGKFEASRKRHAKVINTWAKKFGNKPGFKLNLSVHNPFLGQNPQEAMKNTQALVHQALEGKSYSNINYIPYSDTNAQYNAVLQSSDVYLAMSGGEGRDLPAYHAAALGAHVVALKAHAYLDYFNDSNAVFVNPSSKVPAYDGIFFHQGAPVNQGNIFSWEDDEFATALDTVVQRVKIGENTEGLKLQRLGYKDTVDVLLKDCV